MAGERLAAVTLAERAPAAETGALPTPILLEAIARRLCVDATYNRMAVTLAPYILYTRHDELFVDAVTVERDGKKPKEYKLGTFKLAGLSMTGLTRRAFMPEPGFDRSIDKYAGTTLFAIEA